LAREPGRDASTAWSPPLAQDMGKKSAQAGETKLRIHVFLQDVKGEVVGPAESPNGQPKEHPGSYCGRVHPKQSGGNQRDNEQEDALEPDQPGILQILHGASLAVGDCSGNSFTWVYLGSSGRELWALDQLPADTNVLTL
jgi:hypothetical protein